MFLVAYIEKGVHCNTCRTIFFSVLSDEASSLKSKFWHWILTRLYSISFTELTVVCT